jgi:Arc/MetJ-type ribon-helix-helix transcriptional regulator
MWEYVPVKMPPALLLTAREIAHQRRWSMSALIRDALRRLVKKELAKEQKR